MIILGHYRVYNVSVTVGAKDIKGKKVLYPINLRLAVDIIMYPTREKQIQRVGYFTSELHGWFLSSNTSYCRYIKHASYSENLYDETPIPRIYNIGDLPIGQVANIRRYHKGTWESNNGDKINIISPEPINIQDIITDPEDIVPYPEIADDIGNGGMYVISSKNTLITKFIKSTYFVK